MGHEIDRHRIAGAKAIAQQCQRMCAEVGLTDVHTEWDHEYNIQHINMRVHRILIQTGDYVVQIPIPDANITLYDMDTDVKEKVDRQISTMVECLHRLFSGA